MWWAGWSAPARFANPAVPVLAIPCAVAWTRMRNRAFARGRGGRAGPHGVSVLGARRHGRRTAGLQHARDDGALARLGVASSPPLGRRACRSGSEDAKARLPRTSRVWAALLALAWWCARALAGVDCASRLEGVFLTRGHAVHVVGGDDRCRRRPGGCMASNALAGGAGRARRAARRWRPSRGRSRCKSCRPACSRPDRLLDDAALEPVVRVGGPPRGPQRSDDCGRCRRFLPGAIACASRTAARQAG